MQIRKLPHSLALGLLLALIGLGQARALPPSSTLTGPEGTLSWQVTPQGDTVQLVGSSPRWSVVHTAGADLKPIRTEHVSASGERVVIDYTPSRATVTMPNGKVVVHDDSDLWDADTVDIRIGQALTRGTTQLRFSAVNPSSGKVYGFESSSKGTEMCGAQACTHIKMTLTGALKYVGPKFHYYFGSDGKLLRFEGPVGTFGSELGQ